MRMQSGFRFIDHQQRRPSIFQKIQKRYQEKKPQRPISREIWPDYLVTAAMFPTQEHLTVLVFQNEVLEVRNHSLNLPHNVMVAPQIILPYGQQYRCLIAAVRTQTG